MATRSLLTAVILVALAGCTGTSSSARGATAVAGCYRGSGLEHVPGSTAEAPAASVRPTLVLDSVVEPGGTRRHARVVAGARAGSGYWDGVRADTIRVVLTGVYPPSSFMLRHEGRELKGTAHLVPELEDPAVDTTSWAVQLASTACAPALAQLPTGGASRAPFPPALRAELVAMGDSDQVVRRRLLASSFTDTTGLRHMARGDSMRTARLEEIIRRWGWPDGSRAGEAASNAAFLVLQHSPSDAFRERMLPVLDTLARVGEVSAPDVALLTDRVLVNQGHPQRYGSQFALKNGTASPDPIEDSAGVDARRATMGLMPLALYAKFLRQMYHAKSPPKAR